MILSSVIIGREVLFIPRFIFAAWSFSSVTWGLQLLFQFFALSTYFLTKLFWLSITVAPSIRLELYHLVSAWSVLCISCSVFIRALLLLGLLLKSYVLHAPICGAEDFPIIRSAVFALWVMVFMATFLAARARAVMMLLMLFAATLGLLF